MLANGNSRAILSLRHSLELSGLYLAVLDALSLAKQVKRSLSAEELALTPLKDAASWSDRKPT